MTLLREVLDAFEQASGPVSLNEMARALHVAPGLLEGMIQHWVRKGRLRESADLPHCQTCGSARGCPFIPRLPRSYELVRGDAPADPPRPPCACC